MTILIPGFLYYFFWNYYLHSLSFPCHWFLVHWFCLDVLIWGVAFLGPLSGRTWEIHEDTCSSLYLSLSYQFCYLSRGELPSESYGLPSFVCNYSCCRNFFHKLAQNQHKNSTLWEAENSFTTRLTWAHFPQAALWTKAIAPVIKYLMGSGTFAGSWERVKSRNSQARYFCKAGSGPP